MPSPPSNFEGDAPLGNIPTLNSEGDIHPPGGIPSVENDERHEDSDNWEKPPSVLDMEHFCRVNDLIQQEREDDLLLIEDDDPDCPVNLMMDPVLSVVIACRKTDLALRFIDKLPDGGRLQNRNYFGDTALHVAAAMNDHRVVEALVLKNPGIVALQNEKQETALYKAALNGHRRLFWWLVREGKSSVFPRRKDGSSVLHCAIMGNAPVLALEIAKEYNILIMSRNENAVTPLQLMVTVPDLFRSKLVLGALDELIYNLIPIEMNQDSVRRPREDEEDASAKATHSGVAIKGDHDDLLWKRTRKRFPSSYATILDFVELIAIPAAGWTRTILLNVLRPVFPKIQTLESKKQRHKEAMELTAYLAQPQFMEYHEQGKSGAPTSNRPAGPNLVPQNTEIENVMRWNEPPLTLGAQMDWEDLVKKIFQVCLQSVGSKQDTENVMRWNEPPLILGAQMDLDDFVEKILQVCPQSVTYLDTRGRSVVQDAIESGSRKIMRIINKMARGDNPTLPSWLFSSFDHGRRETILHLAAKCQQPAEEALQMQEELIWFESVKKMIPPELVYSRNKDEKTAEEIFTEKHQKMFNDCKHKLTEMGKTCSGLVAAIIFASSFSVPGEKDDESGNPIYFHRLAFKIFSHAYVIGWSCAATSLLLFVSFVLSPYREQQFRRAIPTKYYCACLSSGIAVVAFFLSFTCNMFLQIYGGQKTERKDIIPMIVELTIFPTVCFLVMFYRGSNFLPSFVRRHG